VEFNMCRLFGAVSSSATDYAFSLSEAPRSLAALSPEHPHGWGLAVHERGSGWFLHRNPVCAREDEAFRAAARAARGELLVAHVRKRTVGVSSVANTHPFRRGRWVFAHNGTVHDLAYLRRRTSEARQREIEGETDSERFFAFLLTAIDEAGGAWGVAAAGVGAVDEALAAALRAATARPNFGAANFLCSDGEVLYAFRFGRTLHVLERPEPVRHGDAIRPPGVLVASEQATDEPWREVAERALLRVDPGNPPRLRVLIDG
jgi:predicted glutamine amidotransferase